MNTFLQNVREGLLIAVRLWATALLLGLVLLVAFTGFGFMLAPDMMTDGLDLIWGR